MKENSLSRLYAQSTIVCLLSSLLLVGCSSQDQKQAGGMPAMPPLPVATVTVSAHDIPVCLEYPAKVKSIQQVGVVARVSGILEKKNFTEGNFVKAGDTLYQIDSDRYEAIMQAALADVGVKEATLKQATRDWDRIKSCSTKMPFRKKSAIVHFLLMNRLKLL